MTQEQKDLLLKDLCARLPYGVKGLVTFNGNLFMTAHQIEDRIIDGKLYDRFADFQDSLYDNVTIKPYLFPMSSMTSKQKKEYNNLCETILDDFGHSASFNTVDSLDWLNKNHFDYRGLIYKGLALNATGKRIYKKNH